MENVDIFISTYKDFEAQVKNPSYRVVDSRLIKNIYKVCGDLDDLALSEHYRFNYVRKFVDLKPYVGWCHYRRYFAFMDDIPDMDEVFKTHEIVVRKPLKFECDNRKLFALHHNIEDLEIVEKIVKEKYPEYTEAFDSFLESNTFFPCNMFIMRREDFIKYVDFMEDIITEYRNVIGTDIRKRILDNKEKYFKDFYPNNTIEYQERIYSFWLERLTNVYILHNFTNVGLVDVKITENKYNVKDNRC